MASLCGGAIFGSTQSKHSSTSSADMPSCMIIYAPSKNRAFVKHRSDSSTTYSRVQEECSSNSSCNFRTKLIIEDMFIGPKSSQNG